MSSAVYPSTVLSQACDCHVHVFDPERFPYAANRAYTPGKASVQALTALHKGMGFSRVVVVQPSIYGTDNACLLNAVEQLGQDRARGIAVVDLTTVTNEELARLHAGGVRGIRLNLHVSDVGLVAAREQVLAAQRIAHLPGWHIQVHASMAVHVAMLDHYLKLGQPVVLDHFAGGVMPGPEAEVHLQQLLKAMGSQPLYVKLSAAYRLPPGCTADELARRFHAAAPQQVLWGSDWPHTGGSGGVGRKPQEVEPFRDINNMAALQRIALALDIAEATQQMLVDNPTLFILVSAFFWLDRLNWRNRFDSANGLRLFVIRSLRLGQ